MKNSHIEEKLEDPLDLIDDSDLEKIKNESSINFCSPQFNSSEFLKVVHSKTNFDDLNKGNDSLLNKIDSRDDEIHKLVNSHLGNFISAKDSIDEVHIKLKKSGLFKKNNIKKITQRLDKICKITNELFKPVVTSNTENEKVKTVLSLVNKYQQIFSIQSNLREFKESKDYKKLTYEYNKAKYYQKKLKNKIIFDKIFEEVQKSIYELRSEILNKIEVDIEKVEQKFSKKNLQVQLQSGGGVGNSSGDGGTKQIPLDNSNNEEYKTFLNERKETMLEYLENLEVGENPWIFFKKKIETKIIDILKVLWKNHSNTIKNIHKKIVSNYSINTPIEYYLDEKKQEILNFLETVHDVMKRTLPDFLRVCIKILQRVEESKLNGKEVQEPKEMGGKLFNFYGEMMNNIIEDCDGELSQNNEIYDTCIRLVIENYCKSIRIFDRLGFVELFGGKHLLELTEPYLLIIKKIKSKYSLTIMERTKNEISKFYVLENYELLSEMNYLTQLPFYFKKHIWGSIDLLKRVMGIELFDSSGKLVQEKHTKKKVYDSFISCLNSFCDCFYMLLDNLEKTKDNELSKREEKMKVLISNLLFVKKVLLEEVFTYFKESIMENKSSLNSSPNKKKREEKKEEENEIEIPQTCLKLYTILLKELISKYLKIKSIYIKKFIHKGFLLSGYNYNDSTTPIGVRSYLLELFLELSLISGDLERIEEPVTKNLKEEEKNNHFHKIIFNQINDSLSELFLEYLVKIESVELSQNACFQIHIESEFIKRILSRYSSKKNKRIWGFVDDWLEHWWGKGDGKMQKDSETVKEIKDRIIDEAIKKSQFQLRCFLEENQ